MSYPWVAPFLLFVRRGAKNYIIMFQRFARGFKRLWRSRATGFQISSDYRIKSDVWNLGNTRLGLSIVFPEIRESPRNFT